MNESQTKHDFIDPALKEAGWGFVDGSRIRLEFPIMQERLVGQCRVENLSIRTLCPIIRTNTPAMPLNDAQIGGFFMPGV